MSRNASASAFGWQFQINMAIYLMIKYFGQFQEMKIEGEKEDIELLLNNSKKIYAQAKSKQEINDGNTNSYSEKLRKALESLSEVNDNDSKSLIYISNLEPNPLNSGTDEFTLVTFLRYNELKQESKEKIDTQLQNMGRQINKEKLIIAKVPFFGEDQTTRQKYIIAKIEDFITFLSPDLLSYKNRFLEMLESESFHNSTKKSTSMTIKRTDILWKLLTLKMGESNSLQFDDKMGIDEEDFFMALEKYEKIISYKEANFVIYNKISNLIMDVSRANPNIRSDKLIVEKEDEIYDIVFNDSKNIEMETIERVCSKIIAKRIFIRKRSINQMFERANKYEG